MTRARVAAPAALLVMCGAVLAGCGGGPSAEPSSPASSSQASAPASTSTSPAGPAVTRAPSKALAPYYSQTLHWSACGDNQCATMTVPLDYAHPSGRTIDIAVLKVPAKDPAHRIGALLTDPGGPGASGTDFAKSAGLAFGQPLLDRFDIVGFDPRGTGHSTPVDCLSDSQLDQYVAEDPEPETPAETADFMANVSAIGAGCVARSGELASHITTVEATRDMDVLRAALGEAKLDYFGFSYGTELGATYADLFPHRVGRFVLDGAVDPSLSSRETSLQQAASVQTALDAYIKDCVDGGGCYLGDSVDAGLAKIRSFLDRVEAQPMAVGGRQLAAGNAFYGIIVPLYDHDYWPILTTALSSAMDGNAAQLLYLSDLYASRNPDGTYKDNSAEAFYAISCLDDPYAIPASQVAAQIPTFEKASPTFGRVFAWGLTTCGGMKARSTVPSPTITGAGAPPIVVIGTTRDPATPLRWAEHLATELRSGVLITRDGDGHTGYHQGNSCVDQAVEGYLIDGKVPQDGLSC